MAGSSPLDALKTVRITDLFPFPVQGRDVSDVWLQTPDDLSGFGLTDVSREDWASDISDYFPEGMLFLIRQVWAEASGKRWFLVYSHGKPTLFEFPLKQDDYKTGDRVYDRDCCKRNPELPYYFGTIESLCYKHILDTFQCAMVKWDKGPSEATSTQIKNIALINALTPRRPPPV